jgi:4-hydroxybenzoate polyprenyltransferase
MPFALAMAVVVSGSIEITRDQVLWILVCLISARTGAMAFNRLLDREIDAINPRTKERELPSGRVSIKSVLLLLLFSYGIFIFGSAMLGRHTLLLAVPVLIVLSFYSWTKRFTSYSHLVLGLALALAPGGVWYALVGTVDWLPVWLMLGVLFWVAGFDIIYSCQDEQFDRQQGLRSIPARFGVGRALVLALIAHIISVIFLFSFGVMAGLGSFYYAAVVIFAVIVFSQHKLVSPRDLSKVNEAFFVRNGLASFLYLLGVVLDRFVG